MTDEEHEQDAPAPVVPLSTSPQRVWLPAPEYGPGHRRDARTGEVCYSDEWLEELE